MDVLYSIFGFTIGFVLVYITIPPLIRVSIAKRLYDTPNERKVNKVVVPTLGGVSIFIGFILSTIIATDGHDFHELKYLIAAITIMFFIGLKDDLMDISALRKLFAQLGTAMMLIVLGNIRFTNLQGLMGLYELSYPVSFVITLFAMIAVINAFNLIDGIDGLASGVSTLISVIFGAWFLVAGHPEYGIMCFCLAGSLVAFFFFNVFGKKHKIFMGDTGSLIIGVIMIVLVIKFDQFNKNLQSSYSINASLAVSIGILILPVIDTIRVFFIRISQKRSPFAPDMNHIHHRLLDLGNSHLKSSLLIGFFNILMIVVTISLHKVLNINNLLISILTLGLILAYIPSFIINRRMRTEIKQLINQSERVGENASRKIKFIGEPYYSIFDKGPRLQNELKTYPKKLFMDSVG
jgi:UDP-N-acetylmuramyl pentapeptide phosphotransferase/UDP-N-acetylglucosamine-1-phosphate transferase